MRFSEGALCCCERVESQGRCNLLCPSTYPPLAGCQRHRCRACVYPDHSSTSTRQNQQQLASSRGSEPCHLPAAAGKPSSSSRQERFSLQIPHISTASSSLKQSLPVRKHRSFGNHVNTKTVLTIPTEWHAGVAICPEIRDRVGTHLNTQAVPTFSNTDSRMILKSSKRNLKPTKTNSLP